MFEAANIVVQRLCSASDHAKRTLPTSWSAPATRPPPRRPNVSAVCSAYIHRVVHVEAAVQALSVRQTNRDARDALGANGWLWWQARGFGARLAHAALQLLLPCSLGLLGHALLELRGRPLFGQPPLLGAPLLLLLALLESGKGGGGAPPRPPTAS